jgi:hypothetical protein
VEKGLKYELFDKRTWMNGWVMKKLRGYEMNPKAARGLYDPDQIATEGGDPREALTKVFGIPSAVVVHANWCSSKEEKISLLLKDIVHRKSWWKCDGNCSMLRGLSELNTTANPLFSENGDCKTIEQLQPYLRNLDV